MKNIILTRALVFVLIASLAAAPALAFLGVGDVVYDPANYAQALQRFAQMQMQLQQLVQTYAMIQNQYNQMLWMSHRAPVDMLTRYRARRQSLGHDVGDQHVRNDRRLDERR